MALAQEALHLVPRQRHRAAVDGGDGDELQVDVADQLLLRRRVRHFDAVVLVEPEGRLTLGREHSDHAKRNVLDSDCLANGVFTSKEHLHHRLAHQGDVSRAAHVLLAEESA